MQLREIDKARYSKRLKWVFAGIVAALVVITLVASTMIIRFFSTLEAPHFWHNLAGVAVAATLVVFILNKLRYHVLMDEVVYVWDLKQQLNRIYRKQRNIEAQAEAGDHDAMIILNFQLRGSKQLYELDDNTITMDDLRTRMLVNDRRLEAAGLSQSTEAYDPAMLDRF